ncbi:MAG: alpha/beta hydrolase [Candidatus Acidiferrales bacterium]
MIAPRWWKYLKAGIYGVVYGYALFLLFATALELQDARTHGSDQMINETGCNTPMTVFQPGSSRRNASVILIHGLSANRRLMSYLGNTFALGGYRVYALDLPGHGDNTDPFTFARAQQCATVALESLIRNGSVDPKTTVLVGHSMGAAIAIRMADRDPVAATVAISPGPTPLPRRMPANLLVFSAQYDIGLMKREAEQLQQAAGGNRTQTGDFAQQRAFELKHIPHATHTSLIFDPSVAASSGEWINRSLAVTLPTKDREFSLWPIWSHWVMVGVVYSTIVGLACMLLLFPVSATIVAKMAGSRRTEIDDAHPSRALALVEGTAFAFAAVLLLILGTPLKFLHMYTGDYLASLLLIVGVLFLLLNWKDAKANFSISIAQKTAALVLGLATILAFGAWLNWQLDDAWLNPPRWLRFAALLPILWIFSYAEEVMLGPVGAGKRRAFRFAIFLLLRLELWVACAVAAYSLASGQILLVILFTFLLAFSVLQRLATDALRIRVSSAPAAALFSAILAAWFIAAVFPLT